MNRSEILRQAEMCVNGGRDRQYGTPEDNFQCIADFWTMFLRRKFNINVFLNAADVATMMMLFKIGRITTAEDGGTLDTWGDIAGYAACGGEIATKDEEAD